MLASYGIASADREDIVQETALRLFRGWSNFDGARSVDAYAYARTIALNILRDDLCRPSRRRELLLEHVAERASPDDPARAALARVELHRVARALRQLRNSERSALCNTVSDDAEPHASAAGAAMRMARMRARRRLTAALGDADVQPVRAGGSCD